MLIVASTVFLYYTVWTLLMVRRLTDGTTPLPRPRPIPGSASQMRRALTSFTGSPLSTKTTQRTRYSSHASGQYDYPS